MFDSQSIFKDRFSAHLKETSRYLRYIFNGHIAIAMFFLVSAIAVYYQQWLAQLSDDFPTALIMGFVLAFIVSYTPVRTLLQEPDLVFLMPAEHKMEAYFRYSLFYSFAMQFFIMLFVIAGFSPLYFHTFPERGGSVYLLTFLVILVFKAWNLIANWWMLKVWDTNARRIDQIIRLLLNWAVFYFVINGDMLLAAITTGLFIILFLYNLSLSRKQAGLAWDILVVKDQNRMHFFYRIANMFTDVPHLGNKVKKRQWLVSLVSKLPFEKKHTYDYLYRITFVRSGDYLGMYVRLIVIGGLFIYLVPNEWMKVIFALLFLYMSIFQMMTLYQHYRTNMWVDLYPVDLHVRKQAIIKWLFRLALVQTALFSIIFLFLQAYVSFMIMLLGGILFTIIFMNGYVKRKIV